MRTRPTELIYPHIAPSYRIVYYLRGANLYLQLLSRRKAKPDKQLIKRNRKIQDCKREILYNLNTSSHYSL